MVAVIHSGKGFNRVLHYNEQKVNEGVAACLQGANYPKNASGLTLSQKLRRLEKLADQNEKTKVNCLHISLNFDPSEKFSDDRLREIAAAYMEKIGFGEQPYLLYRHDDSGHPHVHIVTTNIKANGKRIELHNLGKNVSEPARKEIEIAFGLLKAEDSQKRQQYDLNPVNVQKALYGKTATKRAITTVLNKVLKDYRFTSLPELNAVLRQYNVIADRGNPESRTYQNHGLTYSIIDGQGNKVGVPIKASDFYNQPTLKSLEAKFIVNDPLRQPHKGRVKHAIDWALLKNANPTLEGLVKALEKEGIATVIRRNDAGIIYGITYVDFQTRCVFNGSDLGKQYSAKAIQERCAAAGTGAAKMDREQSVTPGRSSGPGEDLMQHPLASLAGDLLRQEDISDLLPFELRRKKKKRKRL
ncbi:MAG: relaxase/mobilization nuclease domain-containing protein [Bacteroidetes bacterium]|nr:relaxase/mobilization nuclease domain-containing protein [Bacteroidota bacterium]